MAKKKQKIIQEIPENIKIAFNDFCIRELKLDVSDDDRLCRIDETDNSITLIKYNDKFLKCPDEYTIIRGDELELNLLKNVRIMDSLLSSFLNDYQQRVGIEITSVFQSTHDKGATGYCGFKYIQNGKIKEQKSDDFINESLRMFNLITKLNHTSHLYDFKMFDIVEA